MYLGGWGWFGLHRDGISPKREWEKFWKENVILGTPQDGCCNGGGIVGRILKGGDGVSGEQEGPEGLDDYEDGLSKWAGKGLTAMMCCKKQWYD